MGFRAWAFPAESRFFPGQRWANVVCRTLHLVGLGGLGAGYLFAQQPAGWNLYLTLTLLTGIGLVLISLYSNAIWLIQLRGQVILLKLLLFALIPWFPEFGAVIFWLVVILSGWIAHAPARVRYYSLYHRRRLEQL